MVRSRPVGCHPADEEARRFYLLRLPRKNRAEIEVGITAEVSGLNKDDLKVQFTEEGISIWNVNEAYSGASRQAGPGLGDLPS